MTGADLLDWSLFYLLRAMPITVCSRAGALLSGPLGRRAHPDEHANAKAVLARLRPDWAADDAALAAAADRLWTNIGRTYAEFAVSHRLLRAGRVGMEGRDHLQAALGSGRPIVAIFPHLGNWELSEMQIGFLAPNRGAVIVAPPDESTRAAIAERIRRKAPADLLPMSKTVWRQALARLKKPGGGIMLAIDEQRADGRVVSPAFDGPPPLDGNLGKAARLALMTQALVVPFYNERLPGARFRTRVLPALELEGAATDAGAVAGAVLRMNEAFRAPVLRLADQWYMALFADGAVVSSGHRPPQSSVASNSMQIAPTSSAEHP